MALAFLTRRSALFAIPKAAAVPHVEENAGAAGLTLTEAEIADIDRAFPLGRHTGLAML
jgi:diketogulonate reductase-like aldo/keto reductase